MSQKIFYLCPHISVLCQGIAIISHENTIKVSYSCDSSITENPQELIDILVKNYKEYIVNNDEELLGEHALQSQ
jgi:hypothetical protein